MESFDPRPLSSLNNLGNLYKDKLDFVKSLMYLNESLEKIQTNKYESLMDYPLILNSIGDLYLKIGNYDSSRKYFSRSLSILSNQFILRCNENKKNFKIF